MNRTFSFVAIMLALFISMATSTANAQNEVLGPTLWPTTIEDAVGDIILHMSSEDKLHVRGTKKEDLIAFHPDWGTGIRNRYGLWRGNEKLILSACGRPCHPDDAAMKIIEAVWEKLHK